MPVRASIVASALLAVLSLGVSGCEDSTAMLTASLNAPSPLAGHRFFIEPSVIAPHFLGGPSCRSLRPFELRFSFMAHGDRRLALRRLRFEFVDRLGGRVNPIPFPTSNAVAVPGALQFHGIPPAGPLGLGLKFDCGVHPSGLLFIDVDDADEPGHTSGIRISVPVSQP